MQAQSTGTSTAAMPHEQEAEMEEDKSHAETPKEFLHRELGEFVARVAGSQSVHSEAPCSAARSTQ
jgi:hypothetical protein